MQDTNLVRSVTYLMDCFIDEYHDEKIARNINELDLRAQIEVRLLKYTYTYILTFK